MKTAIRVAFVAFVLSGGPALAQTPGMGETRPVDPAASERSGAADDGVKGTSSRREPAADPQKVQSMPEAATTRCDQFTGVLRDDCLRQERAAAGATRPAEPATAPPPQNPR